jgi:hypothetical protein
MISAYGFDVVLQSEKNLIGASALKGHGFSRAD